MSHELSGVDPEVSVIGIFRYLNLFSISSFELRICSPYIFAGRRSAPACLFTLMVTLP